MKKSDGSYVRYWSDTDPSIIRSDEYYKAKKAGALPVYGETTISLGDNLFDN